MKDELLRLAAICEKAEGPNYAIEVEIAYAVWRAKWGKRRPKDIRVPNYTASIDAALSLVSEDAFWRVGHDGEGPDPSLFRADVMYTPGSGHHIARAATPALALCAASLRALAAMEDAHD